MAKMGCQLDFRRNEIKVFGKAQKLFNARSGNMMILFDGKEMKMDKGQSGSPEAVSQCVRSCEIYAIDTIYK